MRRIFVIAITLISAPSMAQFNTGYSSGFGSVPTVLPLPGMSGGYGGYGLGGYGGGMMTGFPSYGLSSYGYRPYGLPQFGMPMNPYQMGYNGFNRPMYPPFGGYGYMPQQSMGNSSMLPLLGMMGMMAMMSSMNSMGGSRSSRYNDNLDLNVDRPVRRSPPPDPVGDVGSVPTYREPENPPAPIDVAGEQPPQAAPAPEPLPGDGSRTGDVVGGAATPDVPPMTPRPPAQRPGVGEPVRTEKPVPESAARIRAHNLDERKSQNAPVWKTFINNFNQCAPGCEPANYASYGHRDHMSCHETGRALDVFEMRCNGQVFKAINNGRFENMVTCMKKKMKVLWHNGRDVTLGHRNHAHFSIGCNNGRTI